ncbi:hornerin-like [Diaphorina citri]|uniref:Hornerin-like n=1 Tax=Diaphorina citri TaxID=121845 RepID=A0A3Q0J5B2_DIACI|nr:hornerin-like [Diaphorina citri]
MDVMFFLMAGTVIFYNSLVSGKLLHNFDSFELDAFSTENSEQWDTSHGPISDSERKSADVGDSSLENFFTGYTAPGDPTGPGRTGPEPTGFSLSPAKPNRGSGKSLPVKEYDTQPGSTAVGSITLAAHNGPNALSFGSHLGSTSPTAHGFVSGPDASGPASLSQPGRHHDSGDPTGPGRTGPEPTGFSLSPAKPNRGSGKSLPVKEYDTQPGSTAVGSITLAAHNGPNALSFGSHLGSTSPTAHGFVSGPDASGPASLSQPGRHHDSGGRINNPPSFLVSGSSHSAALGVGSQSSGGSGVGFSGSGGHASASFGGGFNGPATPNFGGSSHPSSGGFGFVGGGGGSFSGGGGGHGLFGGSGGGHGGGGSVGGGSVGGGAGHGGGGGGPSFSSGGGHGGGGYGGGSGGGHGGGFGGGGGGVSHGGGGGGYGGNSGGGGNHGGGFGGSGGSHGGGGGGGGGFLGGGGGHGGFGGFGGSDGGHQTPIIHKSAYVYVAPPDEDVPKQKVIIEQPAPKKNYQIVFIKAPNPPKQEVPVIPPLLSPQSDKTLIYVLHPKPEAAPPIHIPAPPLHKPNKPEVYFIRYKTQHHKDDGGSGSGEYGGGFNSGFGGDSHGFSNNARGGYSGGGSDLNGFQHVRYGRDQFKKMTKSSEPSSVSSHSGSSESAPPPTASDKSSSPIKYQKPLPSSTLVRTHPVNTGSQKATYNSNQKATYTSNPSPVSYKTAPNSASLSRASSQHTSFSPPTQPSQYNSELSKLSSHSELSKLPTPHFKPSSKDMYFEELKSYQKTKKSVTPSGTSDPHSVSSRARNVFSLPQYGGSSSSTSLEEDTNARIDNTSRHKYSDGGEDEDDGDQYSSYESQTGASQLTNSYMKPRGQNAH